MPVPVVVIRLLRLVYVATFTVYVAAVIACVTLRFVDSFATFCRLRLFDLDFAVVAINVVVDCPSYVVYVLRTVTRVRLRLLRSRHLVDSPHAHTLLRLRYCCVCVFVPLLRLRALFCCWLVALRICCCDLRSRLPGYFAIWALRVCVGYPLLRYIYLYGSAFGCDWFVTFVYVVAAFRLRWLRARVLVGPFLDYILDVCCGAATVAHVWVI